MIVLRNATHTDVARLVALNHAAYPDLVGEGVVFDADQIAQQIERYQAGQIVATVDGVVVGAIATLLLRSASVLGSHTWADATGDGTFRTHDPDGDCLYLADIYVDPAARGLGVGGALYDALFTLCRTEKLVRVVAGGRLFGFHEVRDTMTPLAYVDQVVRGARSDKVLSSQLRAGFVVQGILRDYLHDWRSASYATLLTWTNADLRGGVRCTSSLVEVERVR
jgi:ribosomal protein S18 acetylase RimI-like enzyme